jgi:magnesium chelatase subunit D
MTPWARATLSLQLLWADPAGLGGIVLRARAGPARDAFQALIIGKVTRLHPAMTLDVLDGGVDVSISLAEGTLVHHPGLLEGGAKTLLLTMAERTPPLFATRLCSALDASEGHRIIALDEGSEEDETLPAGLLDRMAFHIDLEGLGLHDVRPLDANPVAFDPHVLSQITLPDEALNELVSLAVTLGISSLRAPGLAIRVARANAALNKRKSVISDDVIIAAELVYAPRATRFPQDLPPEPEAPDTPEDQSNGGPSEQDLLQIPQDILLDAIKAALPADLLDKSGSNTGRNASGSGAGRKKIGNRRGRPLPARMTGSKNTQARVDLMATLRAAVPWQTLRRQQHPDRTGPIIYPDDLRHKRYEDLSDRLLVFAVDASGSAAFARLAEAKGGVELLLAEAYARRDHVALISFRGEAAETLLPPTRSLVQTKRRLAELPGGGGTPLASGLSCGLETSLTAYRKGLSPVLIVLTDGRSNIALDGTANRAQAAQDALTVATQIAQSGIESIVIDTGRRPEAALQKLAATLRGRYVSLPRADAQKLSETVSATLAH